MDDAQPSADSNAPYCDLDPFSLEAQGHSFTFYPHGQDRLKALIELIEGAQQSLQVLYYLFDSDISGTKVRDALVDAAKRGVKVRAQTSSIRWLMQAVILPNSRRALGRVIWCAITRRWRSPMGCG
jgi:phosphatidylserine/phosphatidylglycerophosphate/cardiolipin synthase-like enzyme